MIKRLSAFALALIAALALTACGSPDAGSLPSVPASGSVVTAPGEPSAPDETEDPASQPPEAQPSSPEVSEDGWYNAKEDVALYIHLYGHLPDNYVTKREA